MAASLFAKHFQICYVVRDAEHAIARFGDRFGVSRWHILDTSGPDSPVNKITLAYVGELMIELIEPASGRPSIYAGWTPDDPDRMKFHHFGFLVHNDEEWRAAIAQYAANGYAEAQAGSFGDLLDYHYADSTAELGHFCELIYIKPAGEALFASVPRN